MIWSQWICSILFEWLFAASQMFNWGLFLKDWGDTWSFLHYFCFERKNNRKSDAWFWDVSNQSCVFWLSTAFSVTSLVASISLKVSRCWKCQLFHLFECVGGSLRSNATRFLHMVVHWSVTNITVVCGRYPLGEVIKPDTRLVTSCSTSLFTQQCVCVLCLKN